MCTCVSVYVRLYVYIKIFDLCRYVIYRENEKNVIEK